MTSFEHRQVQANDISLHVATAGDPKKPAVMFLHGFPEGWFSWRSTMEALADDCFVLAPDLRGYGQSDKPAGGYGLMTLTDDVHDIVERLTDKPITLVGHDWGGALTWMYGHRFGETLRREFLQNQFSKSERTRLMTECARPIPVPCTLIWGQRDHFLSEHVVKRSHQQAHCDVEWRPLPAVGHFVSMEAPDRLVAELRRVLARGNP